ncbi:TPA: hypothetical protein ACP32D_006638, partial [Pseudomonas aeruginosa]
AWFFFNVAVENKKRALKTSPRQRSLHVAENLADLPVTKVIFCAELFYNFPDRDALSNKNISPTIDIYIPSKGFALSQSHPDRANIDALTTIVAHDLFRG